LRAKVAVSFAEVPTSSGMPSLTALLSLLAIAGYQNRRQISDILKGCYCIRYSGWRGRTASAPSGLPSI
jgi:hypothetical protein